MLSVTHKARLLRRAGIRVPPTPLSCVFAREAKQEEFARWEAAVQALFDDYAVERAAQSLRNAEESANAQLQPHRVAGQGAWRAAMPPVSAAA